MEWTEIAQYLIWGLFAVSIIYSKGATLAHKKIVDLLIETIEQANNPALKRAAQIKANQREVSHILDERLREKGFKKI